MDILLTHGYFLEQDPAELAVMKPYPPLGLLYISAYLKQAGFRVSVLDSTFLSRSEFERELERLRPPCVGVYATLMTRANVLWIASLAKQFGARVVLGGPEPVNYAEEYLTRGADVIVDGEGEQTLAELLKLFASDAEDLSSVAGAIYMNTGVGVVRNPPRAKIAKLDSLPFPDREAIDLERYLQAWQQHHGVRSVSLITARGCPYTCRWCSHSVYGFSHRRRSVENVADELELINERYRPDQVWYADDVFTINRHWLRNYSAELDRRKLRLPFETITREDRLDEPTVSVLAKMGCYRIWIGAESGSQVVLDAMDRRTDAVRMREMIALLRKYGIRAGTFIMVGYDGETWSDLSETARHLVQALPDDLLTTLAYPIKGTPYYEAVEDRIIALKPWEQGSDRDLTVAGRNSRRFYEHARRWLSSEWQLAKDRAQSNAGPGRILRAYARTKAYRAAMLMSRFQRESG